MNQMPDHQRQRRNDSVAIEWNTPVITLHYYMTINNKIEDHYFSIG